MDKKDLTTVGTKGRARTIRTGELAQYADKNPDQKWEFSANYGTSSWSPMRNPSFDTNSWEYRAIVEPELQYINVYLYGGSDGKATIHTYNTEESADAGAAPQSQFWLGRLVKEV